MFDAVGIPRIHHQLMPDQVGAEAGIDIDILQALADRGHKVNFVLNHLFQYLKEN